VTQPQIARTSRRKSVPNPLFNLITIYDDEDSLKVSLVTPVHIAKEKELERASTPGPNAPIQSHPQSEHEVESSLDIDPLDILATPMEILRDELGSSEQEEEIPQQEIIISIANYQVSIKLSPNFLVLASTSPPNDQQPEVEPSGHIEEVQEPILD
jgi:hypothetical protein